jgi:hypothetical protein
MDDAFSPATDRIFIALENALRLGAIIAPNEARSREPFEDEVDTVFRHAATMPEMDLRAR